MFRHKTLSSVADDENKQLVLNLSRLCRIFALISNFEVTVTENGIYTKNIMCLHKKFTTRCFFCVNTTMRQSFTISSCLRCIYMDNHIKLLPYSAWSTPLTTVARPTTCIFPRAVVTLATTIPSTAWMCHTHVCCNRLKVILFT